MELKEVLSLYRRWIWLLVASLAFGIFCGFVISKIQAPVYEASAKVLVAKNRQQDSPGELSLTDQQLVATYQQLLKTQPVLSQAAAGLGTPINPANIRAEVLPNTQIIQITVQDGNASRAATIANSMAQVLVAQNESLMTGRYSAYEDGLNAQIAQVQKQLTDLQAQITQLNQANVQEQLDQINQQIDALQSQLVSLEKDIAQTPPATTTTERAALAEKQAQLDQLRSLLSLYQQIQTNLTYIGKPVQGGTALSDPQLTTLQSTLNLYQQLYLNLLNDLEAVKLARFQNTPTVSPIESAVPPTMPVRPLPVLYMALAGLVGLLLAAAAVMLIDYFAGTFRANQKVEELLHAPIVGQISDTGAGHNRWSPRPSIRPDDQARLENAFGSLRVNVTRLMKGKPQNTILVTSPWAGEGKTTIATNLAKAFVRAGRKVILVDADLRHPQLHARLGVENHMGLTDVLTNGVDWQEVSCNQDGITIITSGSPSTIQNALIESDEMARLLEHLQRKADIVILDGPPLFLVNAQVLASRVAGVLLVIEQGKTKVDVARSMKEQLDVLGVGLLGVVMNRVPRTEAYYFDGYYAEGQKEKEKDDVKEAEAA